MFMSVAINIVYESFIVTVKLMMVIDVITNPIISDEHTTEIKGATVIRTYSRNRFIFSSTCPSLPLRVPRRNGMTLGQYGKILDCASNLARQKSVGPWSEPSMTAWSSVSVPGIQGITNQDHKMGEG